MRTDDRAIIDIGAFCRRWDMLPAGALVLCAVSGGRDSMTLLHLLTRLAGEGGFRVHAAHFNHRLRAAADRDEAFVRRWCAQWGVPLSCGGGDAAAFARSAGTSVEDGARQLRYRFLEETADRLGASRIATAHHREDNAETVLLHLLRGSGLQGLGGIPPVRGRIVRPLLETSRAEIDAYAARYRIPYVEDETNADPAFTRNRLRREALPLLEAIAPGCAGRIAGAASLLREEEAHLAREAEALLPEAAGDGSIALPVPALLGQDRALRRRLVRLMARRLGAELTRSQVDAVLELGSGGYLDLPGGLCAVRQPHRLVLRRREAPPPPMVLREGAQRWGPWRIRLEPSAEPAGEDPCTVSLSDTGLPLTVALWDGTGRLAVENGSRTIKRLFADRGVPPADRREHPALYRGGRPVAVFGVATDWALRPRPGEGCLVVRLEADA